MAQVKNSQLLTKRSSLRSSDSGFSDKMRSLSKKITSSFRSKTFKDYIPEGKAEDIDKDFLTKIMDGKTGSLTERVETEQEKIEKELAELHTKLSAYRDLSTPESRRALGEWLLKTKTKNISGEKTITEIFAKGKTTITQWKTLIKQRETLKIILESEKNRLENHWLFSAFSYLSSFFKQQKVQETSDTVSLMSNDSTSSQSPKRSRAYRLLSTIFRSLFSSRQQRLEEIGHSLSSFSNDPGKNKEYNPFDSKNKSKVTQEQIEEGNDILTIPLKDIIRDITINDFSNLKGVSLEFNGESLLKKAVFNPFEEESTAPKGAFNPFASDTILDADITADEENTALDADTIQRIIAASEAHKKAVETARTFTAKTDEEKRTEVETRLKAALQQNPQAITTLSEEMTQKIESYTRDIKKYTRLKNLLRLEQKLHKAKGLKTVWGQEIKDIEQRIQEIREIQMYTRQYLDTMKKASLLAIINEDASKLLDPNPFSSEEQIDTEIEKACGDRKNVFNPFVGAISWEEPQNTSPKEEPYNPFKETLSKATVIQTIKQGLKDKKFNIIRTLREESTTKLEELSRCRQLKTILEIDLQLKKLKFEAGHPKITQRNNNIRAITERIEKLEPQETYHKTRLGHLKAIQTRDLFSHIPRIQLLYSEDGMLDVTKVTEQIRKIENGSNGIGRILTQLARRTGIDTPLELQKQVREAMQKTYGEPLDEKIAEVDEELKDTQKLERTQTKKLKREKTKLSRKKTQLLSKKVDLQQFTQPSGTSTSSEELRKKVIKTWKGVLKNHKFPARKTATPAFNYKETLKSCENRIKQLNILEQMIEANRQLQEMPSAEEQLKSIRKLRKKLKRQYHSLKTYRTIEEQVMKQPLAKAKTLARNLSRRFSRRTLSGKSTKSRQSKREKDLKKITPPSLNF